MKMLRVLILVGQVGRIWAKSSQARKIFQTITAVGFFSMVMNYKKDNDKNYQK